MKDSKCKNQKYDIRPSEVAEYLSYHTPQDVEDNLQKGFTEQEIETLKSELGSTIIAGSMMGFDVEIYCFLNAWAKRERLLILSEVTAEHRRHTFKYINFPAICPPHLLCTDIVIENMPIPQGIKYKREINRNRLLKKTASKMECRYRLGEGYSFLWVHEGYKYIQKLYDTLKPKRVVLWNQYTPLHILMSGEAQKRGIAVSYIEYGCIPGTYSIDSMGQLGESSIVKLNCKDSKTKIYRRDILAAEKVIEYVNNEEPNRYVQPLRQANYFELQKIRPGRKNIFFAGQYDEGTGMSPVSMQSKIQYSPIFKSTKEALEWLKQLCIKNDWNLIFRPHPIIAARYHLESYINEVNLNDIIDISDVVITILSQVSYMALFRMRAVVMLGHNELYKSGCVYEAYRLRKLEPTIKLAVSKGMTEKMQECFTNHIAMLLKYNHYDDLKNRSLRYGKDIRKEYVEWVS